MRSVNPTSSYMGLQCHRSDQISFPTVNKYTAERQDIHIPPGCPRLFLHKLYSELSDTRLADRAITFNILADDPLNSATVSRFSHR